MNVRKFTANDARIALKKVKETLGADAVILSNRTIDGVVEIMAVGARDMAMVVATPGDDTPSKRSSTERIQAAYVGDDYRVSLSKGNGSFAKNEEQRHFSQDPTRVPFSQHEELARRPLAPPERGFPAMGRGVSREQTAELREAATFSAAPSEMMNELKALRRIVEQHLAGYAWGEFSRSQPAMTDLLKRILEAGFSPGLANQWLAAVKGGAATDTPLAQVKALVEQSLKKLAGGSDLVEQGGIFALVGPTGVGKTTTTAKLAARCVLRHGRDKVALITSDAYRIGAHEQLRAYGRIMGVPVYAVKDPQELQHTLRDLSHKHLVLIDTMGMSQRDRHVGDQIGMFETNGVRRILLLNATSRGDTMDDVVTAYGGQGLAGCVLTKIDEAVSIAPALDVLIRHGLPVSFVTNGQRVPEDLHLPNPSYLVHRAFKFAEEESPHRYSQHEPAVVMASAGFFPSDVRHA